VIDIIKVDNSKVIDSVSSLKDYYSLIQPQIEHRLSEFQTIGSSHDRLALFKELVFCILTANASAKMALRCIDILGDTIITDNEETIKNKLKHNHRFPNTRARYIIESRDYLKRSFGLNLFRIFEIINDQFALREFLKLNILGIGFKESSHFLRNVGYQGFAILDKHIISMLNLFKVKVSKPRNGKEYIEIERRMMNFANQIDINIDHLDILFWSYKTGEIIK